MATPFVLIGGGTISPMVRKVEYALRLKKLAYESDVKPFDLRSPELFEANPLGQVPALVHGEVKLAGSSVICEYIDSIESEPLLLPADPLAAARCWSITDFADTRLWDPIRGIWLVNVVRPMDRVEITDEMREAAIEYRDDLREPFAHIERQFDGDFVCGDSLTLADLCFAALFFCLAASGSPISDFGLPRLADYAARLAAIPVIATLDTETRKRIERMTRR